MALVIFGRLGGPMQRSLQWGSLLLGGMLLLQGVHAVEYETLDYAFGLDEDRQAPRSLLLMIPDGTDPAVFAMARSIVDPTLQKRLHLDPLLLGQVQTHSATSYITDSAAAATAYATGFKTYDSSIGMDPAHKPIASILEAAKARGMITGMIVTSRVTHATPAGFAAHTENRHDEDQIAVQYVHNQNVDVLLGGGAKYFNETMIAQLQSNGYTVVNNYAQLKAYQQQTNNDARHKLRVVGLFRPDHMSFEIDRLHDQTDDSQPQREPSLAEMVDTILQLVQNDLVAQEKGFFLLIEGSRVDHAAHANDPGAIAREAIAFDEAVGVAKIYVAQHKNIGLVAVADHGSGGMTLGRDGIMAWDPQGIMKQSMSVERMGEQLQAALKSELSCTVASEIGTCKDILLKKATDLMATHSFVTSFSGNELVEIKREVGTAVEKTRDMTTTTKAMGRAISKPARVGWTSIAHDGQDVNLYCFGPTELEHKCRGVHENIHIHTIMTEFLDLEHLVEVETLRLRSK